MVWGGETYFDFEENRVVIDVYNAVGGDEFKSSEEARGIHEIEHARQFLDGEIDFETNIKKDRYGIGGFSYDRTDEENAFKTQSIISDIENEKPLDTKKMASELYSNRKEMGVVTSPEKTKIFENIAARQGRKYKSIFNYKAGNKKQKKH
jgi:hypothetical protein